MNENKNENGNSEIPEVEELVIEEEDDAETIKTKVAEHNQKVKERETKVKEANAQLFARTKKAEGFELINGKWVKPENKDDKNKDTSKNSDDSLSQQDVIYLAKVDIHEDDLEEVLTYSKNNKVSVKEAHAYLKPILDVKAETRKTAEATNVNGGKRGSSKLSDEALYENAKSGKLPESYEDIKRLALYQLKKGRG